MYALASLGLRCSAGGFGVAGAALGAPQGVGCTPWRPLVSVGLSVAFAWQAWVNVHWQGARCTPWRPLVSGALPLALAWQAQHLVLCKGSYVRPGVPLVSAGLSLAFAWQAWDNVHWQGVRCTPWRPLVSAALSVAFAWQAQHLVLCKGSDVRLGVPWSPLLCRWLLRGTGGTHSLTHCT